VCPRLDAIEDTAYASHKWIKENTSDSINDLTSNLDAIWGEGEQSLFFVFR
jgi:hypothetical protein